MIKQCNKDKNDDIGTTLELFLLFFPLKTIPFKKYCGQVISTVEIV